MSPIQFGKVYKKIAPVTLAQPYEYLVPIEFTMNKGVRCMVFDEEHDYTCTRGELLYYYTVSE